MALQEVTAAPLFASRNWLNGDCEVTVTQDGSPAASAVYKHRAYDMTPDSQYLSIGSNDTKAEEYEARFKDGAAFSAKPVRVIALLGINLKNFIVEYKQEADPGWTAFEGLSYLTGLGGQDFSGANRIIVLGAAVTADRARLRMFTTQTPDQEKAVTNIFFGDFIFQPQTPPTFYEPRDDEGNRRTLELINGFKSESVILRADNTLEMRGCSLTFVAATEAERDLFRALKKRRQPATLMPFPSHEPALIYTGRVRPSSYREPFLAPPVRTAGYNISFDFEETFGG